MTHWVFWNSFDGRRTAAVVSRWDGSAEREAKAMRFEYARLATEAEARKHAPEAPCFAEKTPAKGFFDATQCLWGGFN